MYTPLPDSLMLWIPPTIWTSQGGPSVAQIIWSFPNTCGYITHRQTPNDCLIATSADIILIWLSFYCLEDAWKKTVQKSQCLFKIVNKEADWPVVWNGPLCVSAAARYFLSSIVFPGAPVPTGICTGSLHLETLAPQVPPLPHLCCWSPMETVQTGKISIHLFCWK